MPLILVPSFGKRIAAQNLVNATLNEKQRFYSGFLYDVIRLFNELAVRSQLLKHKNKMWKQFKVKNEDTRTMSIASFSLFIVKCEHISKFVLIVDFEHLNVCWIHIEKTNTFEDKIEVYHALCCSI